MWKKVPLAKYTMWFTFHNKHYARKMQGAQVENCFKIESKKVQGYFQGVINVINLKVIPM